MSISTRQKAFIVSGVVATVLASSVGIAQAEGSQPPSRVAAPASVGGRAIVSTDERHAVIKDDGTVARRVGGAVTSASLGTGLYEVIFNRNITKCVYQATIGQDNAGSGPSGEIAITNRAGQVKGVFVNTYNSDGTAANKPFHVSVFC